MFLQCVWVNNCAPAARCTYECSSKIALLALANATFAYNVSRPQAAPTVGQNSHTACLHRLWVYVILMAGAAAFAAAVAAAAAVLANDQ